MRYEGNKAQRHEVKGFKSLLVWQKSLDLSVSIYELQTQLEVVGRLRLVDPSELIGIVESSEEVDRMLNSLVRKMGESQRGVVNGETLVVSMPS